MHPGRTGAAYSEIQPHRPRPMLKKESMSARFPASPSVLLVIALAACKSMAPAPQKSLYDLSADAAIAAVVDDFVANIAADDRINAFFAGADSRG